jgi:hypothetical protein
LGVFELDLHLVFDAATLSSFFDLLRVLFFQSLVLLRGSCLSSCGSRPSLFTNTIQLSLMLLMKLPSKILQFRGMLRGHLFRSAGGRCREFTLGLLYSPRNGSRCTLLVSCSCLVQGAYPSSIFLLQDDKIEFQPVETTTHILHPDVFGFFSSLLRLVGSNLWEYIKLIKGLRTGNEDKPLLSQAPRHEPAQALLSRLPNCFHLR